ncbi:hypothetical protein HELRODRAFT_140970, partial [Helobdella robusta]|uniref:Neurotransmitter-gated ion-channel ligand-binding domain-containing protein n=1 Tax=Helobdella robusta TaxID=6412 RepID=T1EJ22_HELRO
WNDLLLRWDPKDFGGIELVRVPSSKIWTPDIVLYNYADIRLKEHRDAMVLVNNNGTVDWLPQAIFKSTCNIDITNFPFDIQVCKMKFGSWTYDGYKLDVNFLDDKDEFEISDYVRSNEWELLDSRAKKNVKYYYGLIEPYPDLTFFVIIRRVAVFYNYILVLPCVLLSFLTLVIFWLPPESPAKVMLGMSVFVAFFVLLLLLADSTPPAACSIPLIGAYFCANMILITLSTFLAVIIIQNHVRGDRKNKVPAWLKMIAIDGMARVLCMSEFLEKEQQKQSSSSNDTSHQNANQIYMVGCSAVLENDVKEIRKMLKAYITRLDNKDTSAKYAKEWRLVARVLDRIFFYAYIGTIIVSLCTIF